MRRNGLALIIICMSVCPLIGWSCAGTNLADLPGENSTSSGNTDTNSNTDPDGGSNAPGVMTITDPAVTGQLVAGQEATITVSCRVTNEGGTIQSVEADLASLGGSMEQALIHQDGDLWSWTGTVTPTGSGTCTVQIVAKDNLDESMVATVQTPVAADPNDPSQPDDPTPGDPRTSDSPQFGCWGVSGFGGPGVPAGAPGTVKISCMVWACTAGQATSVTVDLNELGGQTGVELDCTQTSVDFTEWYLLADVYAPTPGVKNVALHAVDSAGHVTTVIGTIEAHTPN